MNKYVIQAEQNVIKRELVVMEVEAESKEKAMYLAQSRARDVEETDRQEINPCIHAGLLEDFNLIETVKNNRE